MRHYLRTFATCIVWNLFNSQAAHAQFFPDLIEYVYPGIPKPQPSLDLAIESATTTLKQNNNADGVYNFYVFEGVHSAYEAPYDPFSKTDDQGQYYQFDYQFGRLLPWKAPVSDFIYVLDKNLKRDDIILGKDNPCSQFGSDYQLSLSKHRVYESDIYIGYCYSQVRTVTIGTVRRGAECPEGFDNTSILREPGIALIRDPIGNMEGQSPPYGIFHAAGKLWNSHNDNCVKRVPPLVISRYERYCPLHLNIDTAAYPDEDTPEVRTDLSRVKPALASGITCLMDAVVAAGGAARVNSALRPERYQNHLRNLWDLYMEFEEDHNIRACDVQRAKVAADFNRHGLLVTQRPASASGPHTTGDAVDVGIRFQSNSSANIDDLASGCGVYRPIPINDPPHFKLVE